MSKKGKKIKSEATTPTESIVLESRIDALTQLVNNMSKEIQALNEQLRNISTNFSFHTHDMTMRTGPAEFNKALYDQWLAEQKAKIEAEKQAQENENT